VLADEPALHKLELAHGTLSAQIDAPPRVFQIQTPRALVIDLGCAFDLTVDASGRGKLTVTSGKVALATGAAEVVVPAGSACDLTDRGPGTPHTIAAPAPAPAPAAAPKPKRPAHKTQKAHAKPAPVPTPPSASKPVPAPAPVPAKKKNEPAQKYDPTIKMHHDPLKHLDDSAR
jgi:hypothetical protein